MKKIEIVNAQEAILNWLNLCVCYLAFATLRNNYVWNDFTMLLLEMTDLEAMTREGFGESILVSFESISVLFVFNLSFWTFIIPLN